MEQADSAGCIPLRGELSEGGFFPSLLSRNGTYLAGLPLVPTVFRRGLGDAAGQSGVDLGERAVDAGGQGAHCAHSGEGNECNNQRVLNQILAFVVTQAVDREVQFVHEVLHSVSPSF